MRSTDNPVIVGFCGRMGSGKDYVAWKWLHATAAGQYRRRSFADMLRFEVATEVFSAVKQTISYDDAINWYKPYTEAQRWILQYYGTEFRRAQEPDYWVRAWKRTIEEMRSDLVVGVTDVRYLNEVEAIHEMGGIVVLVEAPKSLRLERLNGLDMENHASESVPNEYDFHVINDVDGELHVPADLDAWLFEQMERR